MVRFRKQKMAGKADRHYLYQESVQDTESEINFVEETWQELRDRPAKLLREDFCGTANTACEWVRRDVQHYAIAIDWDPEVLEWGRVNNLEQLDDDQFNRITLLQEDVLGIQTEPADIVLAMNFSYFLFVERCDLREYFCSVYDSLADDGIFFLDAYGGYDAPKEIQEERECDGFTYIWDQASFNPINSHMTCHIHFEFPDKSRLEKAFSYHWRLWTLPEIRELLKEAGFSRVIVYWEGTDQESNQGNGIFKPTENGEADPGWICYIVAEKQGGSG